MLGKYVRIKITDPIGSVRDGTRFVFPLNYGSVYNADELYSFVLGIDHPVRNFDGRVIATLNPKAGGKQILITAPKSTRFIVNDIKNTLMLKKISRITSLIVCTKAAAALWCTEISRARCAICLLKTNAQRTGDFQRATLSREKRKSKPQSERCWRKPEFMCA